MKIFFQGLTVFLIALVIGYITVPPVVAIRELPSEMTPSMIDAVEIQTKEPDDLDVIDEVGNEYGDENHFKIKLLETGEGFHGDEITAKNGEKWLGLFNENGAYSLRQATLRVLRDHDPIIDDEPQIKTGKSVSVEGKIKPIFLLKNAPNLREGKIAIYFKGLSWKEAMADASTEYAGENMTSLDKRFSQEFGTNGDEFTLKVVKAKNKEGEKLLALILEQNGIRQVLHTTWTSYEGERGTEEWLGQTGTLYWVGDLDGDRKPDFYLDLFVHDNVANKALFLSSKAEKGKLVKKVAHFVTTGC